MFKQGTITQETVTFEFFLLFIVFCQDPVRTDIRVFHNQTKLAMLALLSTLYSHIFAVFFFICSKYFSKCEIRNQGVHEDHISGLNALLEQLIFDGRAKMKLAMLAFLYCGDFVKNSIQSSFSKIQNFLPILAEFIFNGREPSNFNVGRILLGFGTELWIKKNSTGVQPLNVNADRILPESGRKRRIIEKLILSCYLSSFCFLS